jgi:hypothetical protein
MPRFQQNSRPSDRHGFWNWTAGLLALYGAAVLVLVGLMMRYPAVTDWVSQAAQAEFAVMSPSPETAPAQLAQPGNQIRTVRAY